MQIQGSHLWYIEKLCSIKDSIDFILHNPGDSHKEHKEAILEHSFQDCKDLINEMRSMYGDNPDADRKVAAKALELIETEPNQQFIAFVLNHLLRENEKLKQELTKHETTKPT